MRNRLSTTIDDFDWGTQRRLESELAALDPTHDELKSVPVDEDCAVYLRGILWSRQNAVETVRSGCGRPDNEVGTGPRVFAVRRRRQQQRRRASQHLLAEIRRISNFYQFQQIECNSSLGTARRVHGE